MTMTTDNPIDTPPFTPPHGLPYLSAMTDDGTPLVILAMPESIYQPAPNEWAFDVDLRKVGIPLILQLVKSTDKDDSMRIFHKIAEMQGQPITTNRRTEEV